MTASATLPDPKRRWYGLAQRHLRMASRLLRAGFPDGAFFHAYHAYERIVCAFIAAQGIPVPPEGATILTTPRGKKVYLTPRRGLQEPSVHRARLLFFAELADRSKSYARTHAILSRFMTVNNRNDAL